MFPVETVIVPAEYHREDSRSVAMGLIPTSMYEIGDGLYSKVYSNNESDYVIKVTKGEDTGYWNFLMCVGNLGEGNPYLPRIHKVVVFKEAGAEDMVCYVTYMEKLKPVKKRAHWSLPKASGEYAVEKIHNAILDARVNRAWPSRQDRRDMIALLLLAKEQFGRGWFDLHSGNIMLRGRQLVITDPLAGG